ncbi:MAG TPA: hypothetical protein VFW17_06185 [Ktedonobacterales bacterium]|jgi:hypothetical protein|nr:hypothetical protein [Ktedonobacterales bacterium]
MDAPIDWLLDGEPWIVYRTRIDLLGEPDSAKPVQAAREGMRRDPNIHALLAALADWPGVVISSHKSANQPFHRLTFVADLGLTAQDPEIATMLPRIFAHQAADGPLQLPLPLPSGRGSDTGMARWAWALCDTPLIVYALLQFGLEQDPRVLAAVEHLLGLVRNNGWPCAVSPELAPFRGPGRQEDPCPFATLAMLKALAVSTTWRDSQASHVGAETILTLWQESTERHPYMFFMGTDFRKLKVPLIWYDLMHVLDVLSRFPWLARDARLREMLGVLTNKANAQGRFTAESVWTAWKTWEFGQKQVPSRWLTLLAWRIIRRVWSAERESWSRRI